MSWNFDSIPKYVINLDRRRDRWNEFQNCSGVENLENIRRWSAVDGKLIDLQTDTRVSMFTKYNIIRGQRRSHMELNSKGGIGCYLSHVEVWKDFLQKSSSEVGIVFEDDTNLTIESVKNIKDFINTSEVVQNSSLWDFCVISMFYGFKNAGPMYPGDNKCLRLMEFTGFHGYLITKKGIRKILPLLFPIQGHIDWFLSICSQLQYIDLACSSNTLVFQRLSPTDIQKTSTCKICDLEPNFDKDQSIIPKWRLRSFQFEEILVVLASLYLIGSLVNK
jgi:GR25 family glycosyltransferase involved in LPS biosynthesis